MYSNIGTLTNRETLQVILTESLSTQILVFQVPINKGFTNLSR